MTKELPSPELLRKLLRYDPKTGKLFWMRRSAEHFETSIKRTKDHAAAIWNSKWEGVEAFTAIKQGYKVGSVKGVNLRAHRVAWAIFYGHWPIGDIDHADGNRSNNKITNLRNASKSQNCANAASALKSSSKYLGVSFRSDTQKWDARIRKNYRQKCLGCFDTEREAALAYNKAAQNIHGSFARLNKIGE